MPFMQPMIDLQPTLIGPQVLIRPVKQSDWAEMFAAASDPKIWALNPAQDRYTEPVFREYFDSAIACGGGLTIVDRQTSSIVGSSRYHNFAPDKDEIEIGYTFLSRNYWGGKYNAEIKSLMLTHIFAFVGTVVFWVGETNWRSLRAMEKIGGVRRDERVTRIRGGAATPGVVFEIKCTDWS
jgi:RimJ/RimL family protein N-acetyltransferase